MIELLEQHRTELDTICRRFHVQSLEVFGSALHSAWDPATSDLDFLVQFQPLGPGQFFDAFFDLKNELQSLYGRNIDLISPRAIRNPYFLESVNRSRQVLHAA